MKLSKIIQFAVIALLLGISVCSAQPPVVEQIKQYSDPMTENILLAMNEDDYARFSQDFDDNMKTGLSEAQYWKTIPPIKSAIGQYISIELISIEIKEPYTIVIYKAKFTVEPHPVIVRTVFSEKSGKKHISGFWLDSPKLRGQ